MLIDKKEKNLFFLNELETKGISFDILTRANFILNATDKVQPNISVGKNSSVILQYKNLNVEIYNDNIKIQYNDIEEVYEDQTIITKVKQILQLI